MKKDKFVILAILIAFFGFLLRLWQLGNVPLSLHWDEPSWGYNAYSILKTGRDEYGNFMPLIFKAFGDYKSAIYVYLTVPAVAIFGLNEFAVRFPAALFGAISVFLSFFVVKEIFKEFRGSQLVALLSTAILTTSPWHFHYSRGAWENNVLLVLILTAILLFLKAGKKKVYLFYLSALFFGLCFYVYNSAKLLTPLIILGLLLFFKQVKKMKPKTVLVSVTILAFLVLPVFKFTFWGGAGGRLKIMSVFSYPRSAEESGEMAREAGTIPQSLEFRVFHGSFNYYVRGILGRYLNHFSGRFLFFEGDWSNHRHSVPNAGVLNHLTILFLPLGAYFLINRKIKKQAFLWYWLIISPLPAALTRDVVQATRSYFLVFPMAVITAFGIYFAFQLVKKLPFVFKWGTIFLFGFGWLFSFTFYLDQFFVHAPIAYSEDWLYGYKEAVSFIEEKMDDYDQIVFTQKHGQPYIYYLFYTAYDPKKYQAQARLIEHPEGDVGRVERIDKIEFREIYWPEDRFIKNSLFVGGPYELPIKDIVKGQSNLLKEIDYLNGEIAFRVVETVK